MGIQISFMIESLLTEVALERLFSSVNFKMGIQIELLKEALITQVTLERFFKVKFGFAFFYLGN